MTQKNQQVPTWKRMLDIICILLLAPVLIPLMTAIGILIRILSPGPIFFRQERVGFLGQRFECFKFRTMRVAAETASHEGHLKHLMRSNSAMTKLDSVGDPRLISGGRLLRACGLDELPQILNVLRGEMSLVGPRPCVPYEYEIYSSYERLRFATLPGLTGLWQVSGKNRTTFSEMIDLDIQYAENKSLGMDVKIILKTLPALMGQISDISAKKKNASRPSETRVQLGPHSPSTR